MDVIDSHDELLHIACRFFLSELFTYILRYHIEKFAAFDVFHDEIKVLIVIVSLKILHYVGMVKLIKNFYLVYNLINLGPEFMFVQYLDGNLRFLILFPV